MNETLIAIRAALRLSKRDEWAKTNAPGTHMVPLDDSGSSVVDRPTLCGAYISSPGEGTVQTDLVGCFDCAMAMERDAKRWYAPRKAKWTTENGLTCCSTCGGVIGYSPGCACKKTLKQTIQQWIKMRFNNWFWRIFHHVK